MIAFKKSFEDQLTTLQFPTLNSADHDDTPLAEELTLSSYYNRILLPDLDDLAPRSLKEDRNALSHWCNRIGDPPLSKLSDRDFASSCLTQLISSMESDRIAPSTVNKTWRELRAMLRAAVDDGHCDFVPGLMKR